MKTTVLLVLTITWSVQSLPLDLDNKLTEGSDSHRMSKRFINPSITMGNISNSFIDKIRTKRSLEDDCEKLKLCKLHARSQRNFVAAFELYFVRYVKFTNPHWASTSVNYGPIPSSPDFEEETHAQQWDIYSKENARLWDHRQRSIGDCERRYSCYR